MLPSCLRAIVVVRMLMPLAEEPSAAARLPWGVCHGQENVAPLVAAEIPRFPREDDPRHALQPSKKQAYLVSKTLSKPCVKLT